MPAILPGSFVLVTGGSGFIAVHTIKAFLDKGYHVRGTVRTEEKGQYLQDLFKDSSSVFEYVVVPDIAKAGAFDDAVKGVDAVAHLASPFHFKADDPAELVEPAVNGTVGVLKSIQENNSKVQRVVITSSNAAIADDTIPRPHVFTEADWNEDSIKKINELGKNAPAADKYRGSKTLAEKAFWKFFEDEKPKFDGVTICPPMVYGPVLQQISKVEDLNTSNATMVQWFTANKPASDIPDFAPFNWVDVRDVALAHVRALEVQEAGGERFVVGAGPCPPNDLVLAFEKHYPERTTYPKGDASKREAILKASNRTDGSKATRVLGIKYHDLETTVKDTIDSVIKRLHV